MTDYDLIQWLRDKVAKRGKNEQMYRQLLEMAAGDEVKPEGNAMIVRGDNFTLKFRFTDHVAKVRQEEILREFTEQMVSNGWIVKDEPESPESELKPCPFCDCKEIQLLNCTHDYFQIVCTDCGSQTDWFADRQELLNMWNRTGQEGVSVDKLREFREWLVDEWVEENQEIPSRDRQFNKGYRCLNIRATDKFNNLFRNELGEE